MTFHIIEGTVPVGTVDQLLQHFGMMKSVFCDFACSCVFGWM